MRTSLFHFVYSPWLFVLCFVIGAGYAWLLYDTKTPWGKSLNYLLAGLRFLLISILALLILGPLLRIIDNRVENPTISILIDNSRSVSEVEENNLDDVIRKIQDADINDAFELEWRTLSGTQTLFDSLEFDASSTDLNSAISEIRNEHENRNLAGVILVSDGIYNKGMSPLFTDFSFPIFSVGVGDTVPKQDVSIKTLYYNKVSYQGNKFPLIVEISNHGYEGNSTMVEVRSKGVLVDQQSVVLDKSQLQSVEFEIDADDKGMQTYSVNVKNLANEFSLQNNSSTAYIDVVEGKEKFLIVAPAPHPDIGALTAAIESNRNYEVVRYITGIDDFKEDNYDLVIFHQGPDKTKRTTQLFSKIIAEEIPHLIIVGSNTDLGHLNRTSEAISFLARGSRGDLVTAITNPSFSKFELSNNITEMLKRTPPVSVPFGETGLKGGSEALLYQQVGSLETIIPLLAINDGDIRSAVMMGEGLWKWRLSDYQLNQENRAFNELIQKIVQFLSTKSDKRLFRTYPVTNEWNEGESVVFENELYNSLYERVYDAKIDLSLSIGEESLSYSYATSQGNSRYHLNGLSAGVYSYKAQTTYNNKLWVSEGEFVVKETQLELTNLTANHHLLNNLASSSGGQYFHKSEIQDLSAALEQLKPTKMLHSSEQYMAMINTKWLFLLILTLVGCEWVLRKYNGGY